MTNYTIADILKMIQCNHIDRAGGNDYLHCNTCSVMWDYRREDAKDAVLRVIREALTLQAVSIQESKARIQELETLIVQQNNKIELLSEACNKLKDWRATVTAALQNPGGAFYGDVAAKVRHLVDRSKLLGRVQLRLKTQMSNAATAEEALMEQIDKFERPLRVLQLENNNLHKMVTRLGMLRREREGEVWLWQNDGEDHPENLTCPVLMQAEHVRELVAAKEALRELKANREFSQQGIADLEANLALAYDTRNAAQAAATRELLRRREAEGKLKTIAEVVGKDKDDYFPETAKIIRSVLAGE